MLLRLMNGVVSAGVLIVLTNSLASLFLTQDLRYLVNLPLIIVGSGFFVLSFAWLIPLILAVLLSSTLTALHLTQSLLELHIHIFPFLISVMIAVLVNRTRVSNILRQEGLQLVSRKRGSELKEALSLAQKEVKARTEKEAELRRAETILSSVSNLVLVADRDGQIIYASPSIERWLGFSQEEVLGDGWFQRSRPSAEEAMQNKEAIAQSALAGQARAPYEAEIHDHDGRKHWILWQDTVTRDGKTIEIGSDFTFKKEAEREKERLLEELKQALDEVKTLEGLLPICSGCKNIRDDDGYWSQIESFIEKHSSARFSHGLYPLCLEELYPGISTEKPGGSQAS